jgi:hypothetical protein
MASNGKNRVSPSDAKNRVTPSDAKNRVTQSDSPVFTIKPPQKGNTGFLRINKQNKLCPTESFYIRIT